MVATRSYLSEETRRNVIECLQRTLADSTVLMMDLKYAHWNVKGMAFWGLHELFDELADVLEAHVDMLAERITSLGGRANGTAGMAVANCRLPQMPTDPVTGEQFVQVVADRLAIHDANLYDDIHSAQDVGDPDTADLLNEISREVSQYLWFVEAHLQVPTSRQGNVQAQQSQQVSSGGSPGAMRSQQIQ